MKVKIKCQTSFLLLTGILLFGACKKEETSCREYIADYYAQDKDVEVVDGEVRYVFSEEDTAQFAYTGYDTLIFEVTDSTGPVDTVNFYGQGRDISYYGLGGDYISDCHVRQSGKSMMIRFFPSDTAYDVLSFQLYADLLSTYYRYAYNDFKVNPLNNLPLLIYNGKEFKNVTHWYNEHKGTTMEFFVTQEHNLFLFSVKSSTWFYKIN